MSIAEALNIILALGIIMLVAPAFIVDVQRRLAENRARVDVRDNLTIGR